MGITSLLGVGLEEVQIQGLIRDMTANREVDDLLAHRIVDDEKIVNHLSSSVKLLKESVEELSTVEEESMIEEALTRSDVLFEATSRSVLDRVRDWSQGLFMLKQGKFPLWLVDQVAYRDAVQNISVRAGQRGLVPVGNPYDPEFSVVTHEAGVQVFVHLRLQTKTPHQVYRYNKMPFEMSEHSLLVELGTRHRSEILVTNGNTSAVFQDYEFEYVCPTQTNGTYLCREPLLMKEEAGRECLDVLFRFPEKVQDVCDLRFHPLSEHVRRLDDDKILLVGQYDDVTVQCKRKVSSFSVSTSAIVTVPKGCNFSGAGYVLISTHFDLDVEIPDNSIWNVSIPLNISYYFGDETTIGEIKKVLRDVSSIPVPQLMTRSSLLDEIKRVRTRETTRWDGVFKAVFGGLIGICVVAGCVVAVCLYRRTRVANPPGERCQKRSGNDRWVLRLPGGIRRAPPSNSSTPPPGLTDSDPEEIESPQAGPGPERHQDPNFQRVAISNQGPPNPEQMKVRQLAELVGNLIHEIRERAPFGSLPIPDPEPQPDQEPDRSATIYLDDVVVPVTPYRGASNSNDDRSFGAA